MGASLLKRISIWSALYLPHTGGVENFTAHVSSVLAKRGFQVQIVTSRIDDSPEYEVTDEGVDVWRLPCRPLMNGRLPIPCRNACYRELVAKVEAFAPDAVLVNTRFYGHSLEALRFARKMKAKAAVLDHGSAHLVLGNPAADAVLAAYEHAITARAKSFKPDFYGISQKSSEWLAHFGISAKGIIQNAIDAQAFRDGASSRDFRSKLGFAPDDVVVAFCGRLVPEKGADTLVRAGVILAQEGATGGCVRLVFAGDGPMRTQLESEIAAKLPSSGPVTAHLLGNTAPMDLAALFQQSNLFCLPTRSEGFCTSLLEASACALPSVIPDVGGARELIPSAEYGFIMPGRTADVTARALREAISLGADQLGAMGLRARDRVEAVASWNDTADAVLAAFA